MSSLKSEVEAVIKKLNTLPKEFSKKQKRKIYRKAAKILIKAARNNIPKSAKPHKRYKTSKVSSKIRAPKGKGRVVATYYPGNLRKSIRVMFFRKSSDAFVGPKVAKRGKATGDFGKGNRVDGYYAHLMEYGTRNLSGLGYMRKAAATATAQVQKVIIAETTKVINEWIAKNKI